MELRHLRYFVGVAEHEHFGRAAAALHVSQPALSQQIADLERELGVALFDRLPRGVRLSETGRTFLERARSVLALVEAASVEAREIGGGRRGRLTIGLPEGARGTTLVSDAIRRLRLARPDLEVVTTGAPWSEQPQALLAQRIDVGFGWHVEPIGADDDRAPFGEGIAWAPLFADDGSMAVLPADSPLAASPTVSVAALRALPFSLLPRDLLPVLFDRIVAAWTAAGGIAPSVTDGVRTASAIGPLLAANGGWVLTPRSLGDAPPAGTIARPIDGFAVPGALDVLWRADDTRASVRALIDALLGDVGAPGAPPGR
jgi:DNA-binding transcriptional LysR family regulator